jgi:tetraacyldisaccharide 4'-kinase
VKLRDALQQWWFTPGASPAWLLWPLALVYGSLMRLRTALYALGVLKRHRAPVPVIVVGNFTVGGTGKTPIVIALAQALKQKGYYPGVVSRGYLSANSRVMIVTANSNNVLDAGDEPLLIARAAQVPMAVGARRADAVQALLAVQRCDVIISDDGLQHLALQRDVELAVQDTRAHGNGLVLPAGPLREWPRAVDAVLVSGRAARAGEMAVDRVLGDAYLASHPGITKPLAAFAAQRVSAAAGIGNPQAFFDQLRAHGVTLAQQLPLPDHFDYASNPFTTMPDVQAILVTEKDAIKCSTLDSRLWVVPLKAQLPDALIELIVQRITANPTLNTAPRKNG